MLSKPYDWFHHCLQPVSLNLFSWTGQCSPRVEFSGNWVTLPDNNKSTACQCRWCFYHDLRYQEHSIDDAFPGTPQDKMLSRPLSGTHFQLKKQQNISPRVSKHQTGIAAVAAYVIIQVPWMARHCPTHCPMRFLTYSYAKQSMEVWRTLKRTQMVCLGCWNKVSESERPSEE